jgi:2-iminobutanoate/2-iminopropanoate deaminase
MNRTVCMAVVVLFSLAAFGQPQKEAGKSKTAAVPSSASTGNRAVVESKDAPKPIGPYSQAIKAGEFVFCAGQIALDPATGQLVQGDAAAQADRILKNLSAVLAAAGTDLDHAVKTTIFLKNISDFAAVNEAYGKYFKNAPPARSTVGVAALPRDALVEIDIIAALPGK